MKLSKFLTLIFITALVFSFVNQTKAGGVVYDHDQSEIVIIQDNVDVQNPELIVNESFEVQGVGKLAESNFIYKSKEAKYSLYLLTEAGYEYTNFNRPGFPISKYLI